MAGRTIKPKVNDLAYAFSDVLEQTFQHGENYAIAKGFERVEKFGLPATFIKDGAVAVAALAGSFVCPYAGKIKAVIMNVGTTGTVGAGTTCDVLKNAASIFSVATKPVVAFNAALHYNKVTAFDSGEDVVAVGDVITAAVTAIPGGADSADLSLVVVICPTELTA